MDHGTPVGPAAEQPDDPRRGDAERASAPRGGLPTPALEADRALEAAPDTGIGAAGLLRAVYGGPGHSKDCRDASTSDPLCRCERATCSRAKPYKVPGSKGQPPKYCCKSCGNKASVERNAAPTVLATTQEAASELSAAVAALAVVLEPLAGPLTAVTERLQRTVTAIDEHLGEAETQRQAALAEAEQAREERRVALAEREVALNERQAAVRGHNAAVTAQREAETDRDRIERDWRADLQRHGEELGELKGALATEKTLVAGQANQLRDLRAAAREQQEQLQAARATSEDLTERLRARDGELAGERATVQRLTEQGEQARERLAAAAEEIIERKAETAAARGQAEQARTELTAARERQEAQVAEFRAKGEQAELRAAVAEAARATLERELQHVRTALGASQLAAGLVLPPVTEEEGYPTVALPDCMIGAVSREGDQRIAVHVGGQPRPLAATAAVSEQQARLLATALLAVSAAPPASERP
ncbi:hypothetical protein ACIBH1_47935 [Nonomuraea sp. NPDC050663]|uniref:hypothetical protein n=1 Tax=Nonomuraea sp. NPDC050663 TaxID=3364370 RepID=UPI0037A9796C